MSVHTIFGSARVNDKTVLLVESIKINSMTCVQLCVYVRLNDVPLGIHFVYTRINDMTATSS